MLAIPGTAHSGPITVLIILREGRVVSHTKVNRYKPFHKKEASLVAVPYMKRNVSRARRAISPNAMARVGMLLTMKSNSRRNDSEGISMDV